MDIQTGQTLTGFIFLIGGSGDTGTGSTGQEEIAYGGQVTGKDSVRGTGNRKRYLRGSLGYLLGVRC